MIQDELAQFPEEDNCKTIADAIEVARGELRVTAEYAIVLCTRVP